LESFQRYFEIDNAQFALFTGGVAPAKRHKLWEESQFIFSTPQTIEDDVLVTETGCRVLSNKLPSHPDEVEVWISNLTKAN